MRASIPYKTAFLGLLVWAAVGAADSAQAADKEAAALAARAVAEATALSGTPCENPMGEVCNNLIDDDGDGLADCLDPDCTPEGIDFVCGPDAVLAPACRPLLDDPAWIVFKTPPKLDRVKVVGRSVPLTEMDPVADYVNFVVWNVAGTPYAETIPSGFLPNTKFTAWTYKLYRNGSTMIYNFRINKRYNKLTGDTEFILKVKAEGGALSACNPLIMTQYTLEELQTVTIQIAVGDDVFYNTSAWERKSNGWFLSDKYMFM